MALSNRSDTSHRRMGVCPAVAIPEWYRQLFEVEALCWRKPSCDNQGEDRASIAPHLARHHTNAHNRDASCHTPGALSRHKKEQVETSSDLCLRHFHSTHLPNSLPSEAWPCKVASTIGKSQPDKPVRLLSGVFANHRKTSPNGTATYHNDRSPYRIARNEIESGAYALLPLRGQGSLHEVIPWSTMQVLRWAARSLHRMACWAANYGQHRRLGTQDT